MYPYSSHRNQAFASSPINKLPIELLSEIFSLCLLTAEESVPGSEVDEPSSPIITTETVRAPFILSSVCKKWRAVALGRSSLWSNLCITAELIGEAAPLHLATDQDASFTPSHSLHTKQVIYSLQRSRHAPLNVFVDARDPEWNFAEPGVGEDGMDMFAPQALFSPVHMNAFISLLLPHITRWKSLTILTDTWAPLHAALTSINPYLSTFGAPQLESMTLMRCNDFVSYSPSFQPRDLKEPLFLSRNSDDSSAPASLLPRLRHLSLRGVHVDWESLGDALAASSGLLSLELTSHCADVRPSISQFHRLLGSSPHLRSLILTGSGPQISDPIESAVLAQEADPEPVVLEHLQSMNIGYRTALEGRTILKLIGAPAVKKFELEDATYPGDPDEVNASSLLYYLGSKEFVGSTNTSVGRKEEDIPLNEIKVPTTPRRRKSSVYPQGSETSSSRPAFPRLETVVIKNVKASTRSLRTLFNGLSNAQHLELVGMSMTAVQALVPSPPPSPTTPPTCPCPLLRSLCIRDSEQLQVKDLDFIIGDLAASRGRWGACALREVDIHVDAAKAACVAAAASPGTTVTIISDDEEEEDAEDMDVDPFKPGGAFNDPLFDQYYADHITIR